MSRIESDQPVITLVNVPPREGSDLDGPVSRDVYTKAKTPTVGLAVVNGVLLQQGFENTTTLDPQFNPEYGEFTKEDWKLLAQSDVVGITSMTRNRTVSIELIGRIKERNPKVIVIVGGADPTFCSEKWLMGEKGADFVVRNEGEITIAELMKALKDGSSFENIKGISYKKDGEIRHNEKRPLLTEEELSKTPLPYFPVFIKDNSITHAVEGSRGCFGKCDFCSVTKLYEGTYRRKSDEGIIAQIKNSKEGKRVFFVDDNFAPLARIEDAKKTMRDIIAKGLGNRDYVLQLDTVSVNKDPEFVKLCRKMGVLIVCLGIESVDPNVLAGMRKATTADQNTKAVEIFQNNGIYVHAMTIVGSRNETQASVKKLIEWLMKSGVNSVQIFPEGPVPGSELAKREKAFEIAEEDTNLVDGQHLLKLPPPEFTCYGLQQQIFDMYKNFYSRKRILTALKPLRMIFSDPKRALELTLMNLVVRQYAMGMISAEEKSEYTQNFMEYLRRVDAQTAKQKLQGGVIFTAKKP